METRIAELRYKEVISVEDGSRFGYVGDMEVDLESGQVRALVVPGRLRLFGLLGREEDRYIPWSAVRRFGEDIILVEQAGTPVRPRRRRT
ncbi:MAG: YlmC/YmxH family sporulation protein [Lawsonibacter sp.]|nr:YlmC/YmxH family sporulation protein [Lawsonibacter sp.]